MDIKPHLPKIAASLVVGLLAYAILSNSKNGSTANGESYLPDVGSGQGIYPSKVAMVLYDAMKSINITNTEKNKTIIDALKDLTPYQFGTVIKKFGLREYNPLTGNTYTVYGFKLQKHSLPFWLKNELNEPEYRLLKRRFSQYL